MARAKRYHVPGSFYHVMLRGNDGQDIFFSDSDRCVMCLLLQEGVERYGHRIHAFCFMGNHVHLLLQVGEISLSKIMQNIAFRHTQRMNRKFKKIGHLFQGRFKAILIEESQYFNRLLRYIHLNPVRAKIVSAPEKYRWSSHGAYLGDQEFTWLTTDYGLSKFGKLKEEARRSYKAYVLKIESSEELNELRHQFKDGQVLGNDEFLTEIRERTSGLEADKISLQSIFEGVCHVLQIDKDQVIAPGKFKKSSFARGVVAFIATKTGTISTEDIATALKRDGITISSLCSRFSTRYIASPDVQALVEKAKAKALEIAELQA